MDKKLICAHFEHAHQIDNEKGITCTNCGKQLTILETLDPNEEWTITNDGHGNLTIEYYGQRIEIVEYLHAKERDRP